MKYRLGQLIELTYETNVDGRYKSKDVMGMTITKEIIPTKAKVANTDLAKFLVVKPNQFVYNPRTHGKKIGLGFNNTENPFIISWNNTAFKVIDENILNPTYLFMYFKRDEWDRFAAFNSWGSSTEVFSWNAMCDMEIDLPSIEIQQKYVAVYKELLANQQSFENGLEDLKLVCDATIEKIRQETQSKPIGTYIQQTANRNVTLRYDVDSVRGLSIEKKFIETKAKMDGVSLKNYLVVEPDEFAYVTVTSRNGDKISLAHNNSLEAIICSSSYITFKVTSPEKLIPSYLNMFFRRDEFDRYSRFNSWGSARETFNWEDMQEVKVPIPDINIQRSIVDIYNAYINRRKLNEHLKQKIKDICPILINGAIKEARMSVKI